MDMKSLYKFRKEKGGISEVIVTVIMVGLVLAAIAIVWGVVNGLIKGKLKNTESCLGNLGEINIDSQYTCYDTLANPDVFQFSISIGDAENIQKIIVSISGAGATKSFELNASGKVNNLANFESTGYGTDIISIPGKNEGKTYVTNFFASKPDSMKIVPVINGQQCEISDALNEIDNCI